MIGSASVTIATYSGEAPWKNEIQPVMNDTTAETAKPASNASTAVCGEKSIYVKVIPAA